jgi:hypothetical protein
LELREIINFVDRLTALFLGEQSVDAWEFVYDLPTVSGGYQLR